MTTLYDFLTNALPWIAIGLFAACSCVTVKAKAEGTELSSLVKGLSWSPALCFLFLAITELISGNQSSGTTWLVLSVANTVINFSNLQNDE